MRHYECKCLVCRVRSTLCFREEPFPEIGQEFLYPCRLCGRETCHTRTMSRKAAAELRRRQREEDLRGAIALRCEEHGFTYRFLYQSVIISTGLADWCFDYHQSRMTLYHQSVFPINRETGEYAKSHCQFRGRRMKAPEVVDYIAAHEDWRARNPIGQGRQGEQRT